MPGLTLCCRHLEIIINFEQGAPLPHSVLGPNEQWREKWDFDCGQVTGSLLQSRPTRDGGHHCAGPLFFSLASECSHFLIFSNLFLICLALLLTWGERPAQAS